MRKMVRLVWMNKFYGLSHITTPEKFGVSHEEVDALTQKMRKGLATPMKLYIADCCEHHSDNVICVFDTPEAAINFAKEFVRQNARHGRELEEAVIDDWLFYGTFGEEDSVRVLERELNDVNYE